MRISDWSSDVCSSDLHTAERGEGNHESVAHAKALHNRMRALIDAVEAEAFGPVRHILHVGIGGSALGPHLLIDALGRQAGRYDVAVVRSEEHTSELQSLMRISYAVFCLKKNKKDTRQVRNHTHKHIHTEQSK